MLTKIKTCQNCNKEFEWRRGMSFTKMNCSKKCHSEHMSKKRLGENNPAWKEVGARVKSLHCWIRDNFTRTKKCEFCGKECRTDWSNKDHLYTRKREDWQELCRSCHQKYDYSKGLRIWSRKK